MRDIKVTIFEVQTKDEGNIEIIYIPDQTQVLHKGQQYRIVFPLNDILAAREQSGKKESH